MNALFRHLSVRFWMTAVIGTLGCMAVLPWWSYAMGIKWLALPAMAILSFCFLAIGWGMNRLGLIFVGYQTKEAAVWERAGMMAEAEAAYHRAVAQFDSFWLSPLMRRRRTRWITGLLARFYVCQPAGDTRAQKIITAYLARHPQDEAVVERWLEHLLVRENHLRQEHDTAACVAEVLADNDRIQYLLMQFFLANGRTDFEAMQTYRRVWQIPSALPDTLIHPLARLLLNESWLNHWALQVYLKAYDTGMQDALEGIAAAARWMQPNVENHPDLMKAEKIVAGLDPEDLKTLTRRLKPRLPEPDIQSERQRSFVSVVGPRIVQITKKQYIAGRRRMVAMVSLARDWRPTVPARWYAPGAVLIAAAGVLIIISWHTDLVPKKKPPEPPPAIEEIQVTDPFTIQVAAYLSAQEAQNFVEKLKKQQLDAFYTKATSTNRTWYQVKVSHFLTKDQARRYGQALKSKGVIDDFYVANYRPGQK